MKVNRLFSPIGIFITILLVNTFRLNSYVGLVDASTIPRKGRNLFSSLSKLVMLKRYKRGLNMNKKKHPQNAELDLEISRTDEEISKLEDQMEKESNSHLPARDILSPGEIRLSGEDLDKLIAIVDTDLLKGKGKPVVTPSFPTTPGAQDGQVTPGTQGGQTTPGSQDEQVTPGAQDDQITSGAQDDQVTPGTQDEQVTPGVQDEQVTPGAQDEQVTPGAQDEQVTPGAQDSQITPGAQDDQVIPGGPFGPTTPGSSGDTSPLDSPSSPFSKANIDFSTLRREFNSLWDTMVVDNDALRKLLNFGVDQSLYDTHPVSKRAFSQYIDATSKGVDSVYASMRSLMECRMIGERDLLFLQSFIFSFSDLAGIEIPLPMYCLLFTNSHKPNVKSFISNFRNYLNTNGYTYDNKSIADSAFHALNYVATKTFSRKNLTVSGVKRLVKENKELANQCDADDVTFALSLLVLSELYSYNFSYSRFISLVDICTIFKRHADFESRLRELSFILYIIHRSHTSSWLDMVFLAKMSLESAYKALSISFSDYFLDTDLSAVKKLTPMDPRANVGDIIRQVDDDDVIRTSDRHISGPIPIPEIPGPPSRRAGTGYGSERDVPVSTDEIFRPARSYLGYDPFKKSLLHPPRPENLPEKASGRKFVNSLEVHMKPRDYETEFMYGSSSFVSPQLSYFKRVSEREYNHNMKLKKIEEERKRLEKKREQKMTRGYKDLRSIKDSMDGEESVSELPDTSEEPSPLPDMEESVKQVPSKFETKLHKLVPKSSNIYTQPSQRFHATPLTYTTLKPKKGMLIKTIREPATKFTSEILLEDEVSEGTIGLPSTKDTSLAGYSPEGSVSEKVEVSPPLRAPESVLTTEIAAREILVKCPDLTKSQRKRALSLFRVLKYLYKGSTAGWYITAFCRATYFAERDVCIEKGTKSLDIKKMASECYTALKSSSFIKNNPALSNIARQVCYSYYKKRATTVCMD
ncbi:arabinogalactan protein [Cryptosporidium ubiquitum]|uniref:Arabinogalactan protein n=1 Tax=Cryptosporidium ubiquitum TaxID=857276 RepID=A0A1J4MG56_9CRYT|nr:arabinogalactan protein [Cryptosporidium ubiquitum]OII73201.1 arabinogalactan protein [Cryptosporidium ubiquitum]